MTNSANTHSDTESPCSECALNIKWGGFSLQLKSTRWGLLALTAVSFAVTAWAVAQIWG